MKKKCNSNLIETIVDPELTVETEASRRSKLKVDEELRALDAYSVDTYLLRYRQRLLTVPSKEYPKLQCAIDAVQPRSGGYIIELVDEGMIYTIDDPMVDDDVDSLIIRGAGLHSNPFNGRAYVQRVHETISYVDNNNTNNEDRSRLRTRTTTLPVEPLHRFIPAHGCSYDPGNGCQPELGEDVFGKGPFDLRVNGNRVTVTSDSGIDPCFDGIPCGSKILFITSDGAINGIPHGIVTRGQGNTIIFSGDFGLEQTNIRGHNTISAGTGFVFVPSIKVEVRNPGISLEVMNYLSFENIELDAEPMFYIGATQGAVTLRNCWISGTLVIRRHYLLKIPNVFTGFLMLWPSSVGEAYCQTLFGVSSRMQAITNHGMWSYCHFLNMAHGVEMMHSSIMNYTGSDFVRCCLALSAECNSEATLTNVVFAHCRCATMFVYDSVGNSIVTSIPGAPNNQLLMGPWFISNVFMIVVFRNSQFIGPMTNGINNLIPFVIDGKIYTTIESNPLMNIGPANSMAMVIANPFVPDPTKFGCTRLDELVEFDILDAWGVASPGFVSDMSSLDNEFNVLAENTIRKVQNQNNLPGNNLIQL